MGRRLLTILVVLMIVFAALPCAQPETAQALTTNIKVGFCAYISPYQFMGSDGQPDGFNVDLLERIADKMDLVLEYIPYGTTMQAMESLEKGEIDMVRHA